MITPVYINSVYAVLPSRGGEPDYKAVIKDANLRRRMSRIVRMGVASALKCLEVPGSELAGEENVHPDAIATATALGCLADSERFMSDLLDREEQMLNPTAFIQSVFNTVGAQSALLEGIKSYNMTYVHRGNSFTSALLDGILLLNEGKGNVLVEAFDEVIPASEDILSRLGKWQGAQEGAVSFLLSDSPHGGRSILLSDIVLKPCTAAGHVYSSMDSAVMMYDAACRLLEAGEGNCGISLPMLDFTLSLQ
ncbi:MAG: beta-ketoacyl synthase chain length factor [Bacteroidales bacterium]|nr:beta-ketoacyl synthase chain length factor [Bacteroidales bacterium]